MADIAAADVTYTKQEGSQFACPSNPKFSGVFKVAFGNGTLTYPSGGIPLTPGKLGCPANIESLDIMDTDDGSGKIFKFDFENKKIRIYNPLGAHAHDFLVKGGTAAAGTDALNIKTAIVGKEAATDATALGADSATKGGVLSKTAGSADELGNVAVAATVLYVKVVGW